MAQNLLNYWQETDEITFAPFFDNAPVMMHITDADGILERVSRFWTANLGYDSDEVIGRRSTDFLTPESRRIAMNDQLPVFRQTGILQNVDLEFMRKDGSTLPVLLSAVAQHDASGAAVRSLAILIDNTAARLAEAALIRKAREAETANRAKTSFLANMSHEIRTPLNGVLGMASALSQTALNTHQERMLAVLSRSGHQLLGLLDDILDLSKIEAGEVSMETESFEPEVLVTDIMALFEVQLAGSPVTLRQLPTDTTPCTMIGNAKRIRQVITNLVSNAVKFTNEGSITISCTIDEAVAGTDGSTDSFLNIRVADTGSGIPDHFKEAVFGRFHKGMHEADEGIGGAGLGLAIANTICGLHGGGLDLQDTPGGGATFTARFRVDLQPVIAEALPSSGVMSGLNALKTPLRILVAEDNETNRMVLEAMLFDAPVELVFAENGQLALDAWQREPFDGAIIDIRMPVMGGLEVMRRIRNDEARRDARPMPLIACSANVMKEQINSYLTAGFDRFTPKPVMLPDLVDCLLWVAKNRRDRTETIRQRAV